MILDIVFVGEQPLTIDFGEIMALPDSDWYEGLYEITPSASGKILLTEQKRMHHDVTINPIPYFSVSNAAGGNTICIGGEE